MSGPDVDCDRDIASAGWQLTGARFTGLTWRCRPLANNGTDQVQHTCISNSLAHSTLTTKSEADVVAT
eukprot:1134935-Amphidinium_carterae.1